MDSQTQTRPDPPDQTNRNIIRDALDTTILVEAAAGTGKTTAMLGRMVGLIATGCCKVDTIAAVTFTRKAAAEIRSRFQLKLEKELRESTGKAKDRLNAALIHIERCFIGTIHSFCGRLLRERPVEAGIDINFQEIDEETDARLRQEAWREYIDALMSEDQPILSELESVGLNVSRSTSGNGNTIHELQIAGLEVAQLGPAFMRLIDFPDVAEWPTGETIIPAIDAVVPAINKYALHIKNLMPIENCGRDKLLPRYQQIERMIRLANMKLTSDVAEILEVFREYKRNNLVQKNWPEGKEQALAELDRWNTFTEQYAKPFLKTWREYRYEIIMRALHPAQAYYRRLLRANNYLNFQDLLLESADLLKNKPQIRSYFQKRFTHLLVDEFQDTDPIQAEVMLMLTADDVNETDWKKCRPRPGSLFVVGDPKQSIYRFRRADIVTYRHVKRIIEEAGGKVVSLSANFRSSEGLIEWVNESFADVFAEKETDQVPRRRDLMVGSHFPPGEKLTGLFRLVIPKTFKRQTEAVQYEADYIARTIYQAVEEGWEIPDKDGMRPVAFGDFMIITRFKSHLSLYGQKLEELNIPHRVSGGSSVNQVNELNLLYRCLRAIARAEDPVALLSLLRSGIFGVSDATLYAFRKAKGKFSFEDELPESLGQKERVELDYAFTRLRKYAEWLKVLPLVTASERIVQDLGIAAQAAAKSDGSIQAGSLLKAIELLRSVRNEVWSLEELVEYVERLTTSNETHDGIPVGSNVDAPVQIMNLHKAKGLEAGVVFLAGCKNDRDHDADLHIDRAKNNTKGYMAIYGQANMAFGSGPLLAHPVDWETYAESEQDFLRAEGDRLLYVAGTRARVGLVISCREGKKGSWDFFNPESDSFYELDVPATFVPAKEEGLILSTQDAIAVAKETTKRWEDLGKITYDVVAAKSHALSDVDKIAIANSGEHGTEWGTAIHTLLEAAMAAPNTDFNKLALSVLDELGLDIELKDSLLESVSRAMGNDIWNRALNSTQQLVEVPFTYLTTENKLDTLVRGVIDLAFREQNGWVLVDYKSDRIGKDPDKAEETLRARYAAQLAAYTQAWEQVTGQKVVERGLLLTHYDKYVSLP